MISHIQILTGYSYEKSELKWSIIREVIYFINRLQQPMLINDF